MTLFLTPGCGGDNSADNEAASVSLTGQAILGPLAEATVEVYALSTLDSVPVYVTTTSRAENLNESGLFTVADDVLRDEDLYLVKVVGGEDLDPDDDGVPDENPKLNQGSIHAVLTPPQIRRGGFHVSILTEAIYQRLRYLLEANYPLEAVLAEIERRTGAVLSGDVDGDRDVDGDDLAAWHPVRNADVLWRGLAAYRPLIERIHDGQPVRGQALALTEFVVGSLVSLPLSGPLAVAGDFAYAAGDPSGLHVIDISDPTDPRPVSEVTFPGRIQDIQVSGDFVYVINSLSSGQGSVFGVIDVSNPTKPAIVADVNVSDSSFGSGRVEVAGNLAYLSLLTTGLLVVDIGNPSDPVVLGSGEIEGLFHPVELVVDGDIAYALVNQQVSSLFAYELLIFDLSDPVNPIRIGRVSAPAGVSALNMQTVGTVAYVGTSSGLQTIDISDPSNPSMIASIDTVGGPLAVVDNTAYQAGDFGLRTIDVSDTANPRLLGNIITPGDHSQNIAAAGNLAFLASENAGLQIIRLGNAADPALLDVVDTPHAAQDVEVAGDFAYVGTAEYVGFGIASGTPVFGVAVIDIADPMRPVLTGAVETTGSQFAPLPTDLELDRNFAYLSNHLDGLAVFDIGDPLNPLFLGSQNILAFPQAAAVSGSLAYIADGDGGLEVIDLSDPSALVPVGAVDTADFTRDVEVQGNHAYVAGDHFQVADVSSPTMPSIVGLSAMADTAEDVEIAGTLSFIAEGEAGVQIFDISNPLDPILLSTIDTPGFAKDLDVAGTLLYVADSEAGVQIINISDPTQPRLIHSVNTLAPALDVEVVGRFVYVAIDVIGLQTLGAVVQESP